jgi:outer membrane protein TolC
MIVKLLCCLLLACLVPGQACAQAARLSLTEAVRLALVRSPDIEVQRQQEQAAAGFARSAAAPFDLATNAIAGATRDVRPLRADERLRLAAAGLDQQLDGDSILLGAARQFDSGIQLGGSYAFGRVSDNLQAAQNIPRQSADRLSFTVKVPLLKNIGREQAAFRNAAEADALAARSETEQAAARVVLAAVQAYWEWTTREAIDAAAAGSEARVRQLLREIDKLVAEDELPPAELNLVSAAVGERSAARIASRQRSQDARFALARLYGMDAFAVAALGAPAEALPERDDGRPLAALRQQALASRADLAALRLRESAMQLRRDALRSNGKPLADLELGTYYAGLREGARSASSAVDPTARHAGPGLSARLVMQWPVQDSANLGAQQVAVANHEAARVRRATLEQAIDASVDQAYQAYAAAAQQLEAANQAVDRYRAALRDTSTRRQLGAATLIDVLNVEDRLNNAILARLSIQQALAQARAQVLFETGALLRRQDDASFSVALDALRP